MAATQYNLFYDATRQNNEYVHVSLLNGSYLYLGSIFDGGSFGLENHLMKVAKSDLTLSASKKWDTALTNMNVQGLCTDGTHLYWAMCYNNVLQYSAIVKTDLNLAEVESVYWTTTGICPQQIQIMKAYDGTNYLISTQNSMANRSALRTLIAAHANWGGSITTTTNRLFTNAYVSNIKQIDPTSSGGDIVVAGVQVVSGINRAYLAKIAQINGAPYGRLNTTIAYESSLEYQGFEERDTFAISVLDTYIDPDDSAYMWVLGNYPKDVSTPAKSLIGRNTFLARFKLSDMTLQNLVEITSTKTAGTNYSFAGASLLMESDKIYISTWHLPHTGLGDDAEVSAKCTYVVTCLDKSQILAGTATVNFSLAYEEGGSQGQTGNLSASLWSDGTYIYACPWTSIGPRSGWNAAVIKIDRTRATGEATVYDSSATIKEYDFSGYLSFNIYNAAAIAEMVAGSHGTWHNHIATDQAWDSTADVTIASRVDGIADWTPTVKGAANIDSNSLIEYIVPNGGGDSIRSVYGQISTWVPSGTSTANLYTLVNETTFPNNDSTSRIQSRLDATWTGEMFTLTDPSTAVQRILKLEVNAVARYGGSTYQPYFKYLWRTTNAATWQESSAILVTTTYTTIASIDITTVATAAKPNWTRDDVVNLQVGEASRGINGLYAVNMAQEWVKITWEPFDYNKPTDIFNVNISSRDIYEYSQVYDVAATNRTATGTITVPTILQTFSFIPANRTATASIVLPTLAQVQVFAPSAISRLASIALPTLTQIYAATPANITKSGTIAVPALSQLHNMAPLSVAATGRVAVPTLTQVYSIIEGMVTAGRSLTVPTISQVYGVLPAAVRARAELAGTTIGGSYDISVPSIRAAASINAPASITQVYSVLPASKTATAAFAIPTMAQSYIITAGTITITRELTVPSLGQVYNEIPANVWGRAVLSDAVVSGEGFLTILSIRLNASVNPATLTQAQAVSLVGVSASARLTAPTLAQSYVITKADIAINSALTSPLLTESASPSLNPDNIIKYQSISLPLLSQMQYLNVSSVTAGKAISALSLTEIGADVLSISSVTNTAGISAPILTQIHNIQASNISRSGTASVTVLTQDHIISSGNMTAMSAVNAVNLVYDYLLTVSNITCATGISAATLVIDAWTQTLVIDGLSKQSAITIATLLQTHNVTPDSITGNASLGTASIGSIGKIFKPQMRSLSHKRLTIENK